MRHNKTWLIAAAAVIVLLAAAGPSSFAQVVGKLKGSKHDLNTFGGLNIPGNQICAPCHTPHKGNETLEEGRYLWNHTVSTKNFTLYTVKHPGTRFGSTSSAGAVLDDGSKMCLSCHDGAVSLDSYGGRAGTAGAVMDGRAAVGEDDLSNDHPIGVGYPGLSADGKTFDATAGRGYFDPTPTEWRSPADSSSYTGGAAMKLEPLPNGKTGITCNTCHTPHSNKFQYKRMSNDGSAMCLKCHDK
jgi:predicted CXXCH cytochrome family protein